MEILFASGTDYPVRTLPVKFPVESASETMSQLARFSGEDGGDIRIYAIHSAVENLERYVTADASIPQLNELAQKIAEMSPAEHQKLCGALDIESPGDAETVLKIADSLDKYEFLPGVFEETGLGYYLVQGGHIKIPENDFIHQDFLAIGSEYISNHEIAHVHCGIVLTKNDSQKLTEEIARKIVFELRLISDQYKETPYTLTLPASDARLERAKSDLGVSEFAECSIFDYECQVPYLKKFVPKDHCLVETLIEFAAEVECLSSKDGEISKLCAVFDAERPETMAEALKLVINLDDYERINTHSAYDYGYHVLYESDLSDRDIDFNEEVRDFIDFEEYGKYRLKEDGVCETAFGLVRRISEPFPEQQSGMIFQ